MDRALEQAMEACIERTKEFWEDARDHNLDFMERMQRYVAQHLEEELIIARERGRLPDMTKLRNGRCDVLVLLVGHSFEPLLQAIYAYQPHEVVPILHYNYGDPVKRLPGTTMLQRLDVLLRKLKQANLVKDKTTLRRCLPLPEEQDTPSAVFRFLLGALQENWEREQSIVIDITGAKKSMVAGAFFFAAYSNTPISYVDFDRYDQDHGRPYGCTCKIDLIANPYRDFHLRDWAEVRRLYEQYAFAAARERLAKLRNDMRNSGFFEDQCPELQATSNLLSALTVYEAWDNGDYRTARQVAEAEAAFLQENKGLPDAVRVLGDLWPQAGENSAAGQAAREILDIHFQLKYGAANPEDSIFARPRVLLAYVEDELSKIKRLLAPKEDYRAAYLRAAGLDEFLLRARLALAWLAHDYDDMEDRITPNYLGHEEWKRWFRVLADHGGVDVMREVLQRSLQKLHLWDEDKKELLAVKLRSHAPPLETYWQKENAARQNYNVAWLTNDYAGKSILARLRGEAIHTHLYLNEEIAYAAVSLVERSVEEFKRRWLAYYHRNAMCDANETMTRAPAWSDLCRWCGINFLPPYQEEGDHDTLATGCGS